MIELARAAKRLERLVHHSSVFVSGDRSGVVRESELAVGQGFRSPVEESLALAWIRAGAIGILASMEGDRGEMAGAEWAWLRTTACPLGEAVGHSYRLAFASLPETFAGMPEQKAGAARSQSLFDVMLRGQAGRALIGDPAVRILGDPLDPPPLRTSVRRDEAGRVIVEAEPTETSFAGENQFLFTNTLTSSGMSGNAFTERRLFARVEVPSDLAGRLGAPEIRVEAGGKAIPLIRTSVRHEVWGGRRFVCVLVESGDGALAQAGTRATFAFPVAK